MSNRGDKLLAAVAAGEADGATINRLLDEFFSGYPISRLRDLLNSEDEGCTGAGAFILSELGTRAAPLLDDLPRLLSHRLDRMRAAALDAVLVNAGPAEGRLLSQATRLLRDPSPGVRWKAMMFLAAADEAQLEASAAAQEDEDIARLTRWLAAGPASAEIRQRLSDSEALARVGAAVAAARAYARDPKLMEVASTSDDDEVRTFAEDWLRFSGDDT